MHTPRHLRTQPERRACAQRLMHRDREAPCPTDAARRDKSVLWPGNRAVQRIAASPGPSRARAALSCGVVSSESGLHEAPLVAGRFPPAGYARAPPDPPRNTRRQSGGSTRGSPVVIVTDTPNNTPSRPATAARRGGRGRRRRRRAARRANGSAAFQVCRAGPGPPGKTVGADDGTEDRRWAGPRTGG